MHRDLRCPDRRTLQQFLVGAISDDEASQIENHLAGCRACLNAARVLVPADGFVDALRAGVASGGLHSDEVDQELLSLLCQLGAEFSSASEAETRDLENFLEPPESAAELGRFGPYHVLRKLGQGGMGVVYLARQERPARLVALKVLARMPLGDRQRLARFRAEADCVAGLGHPNVVRVYDAGECSGLPYYTMEYMEGGSLARKLAESPLPAREAAVLLTTLARAIQAAHEHGVLHRDLKPSNVLLAPDGSPKVSDFGLAKQLGKDRNGAAECHTDTGAILGTPGYMAPEQSAAPATELGPTVDVYALGAILYEALTGRPPFKGATVLDTLQQARSADPVPPSRLHPGVPRDLQAVCLKCLEKNPRRRYPSALDLAEDLTRFLRGEPTRARPLGPAGRVVKWAWRRPALAALVASALLAGLGWVWGTILHNAQLRREVQRAAASEAETRRQRQLAAVNYQAARDALNRVLEQLQRSSTADIPRLKELRRGVLKEMLAFYESAVRDRSDVDPAVALDLVIGYQRIAQIQWQLGDGAAARTSARKSLAIVEKLAAADPDNSEYQHRLGSGCIDLACYPPEPTARDGGQAGIDLGRRAMAIYERLLVREPDNPTWRQELATAHHNLGNFAYAKNRPVEAGSLYGKAAAIRRPLLERCPDEPRYRTALAEDELCLGLVESHIGHPARAVAAYKEADGILQQLMRAHPEVADYAIAEAALYANWSFLIAAAGPPQAAIDLLARGIRALEPIFEREPSEQLARERLINLHGARAQILEGSRRFAEAVPDWERVVRLENREAFLAVRPVGLANALARSGAYDRAAAVLTELAHRPGAREDVLYNVACIFALCAEKARADSQLPVDDRARRAESYALRAVETLQKLSLEGYFAVGDRRNRLKGDPDLQALRGRADFRRFLARLGGS